MKENDHMTNPFANAGATATAAPQATPTFQAQPATQPAQNGFSGGQQFADAPSTNPAPAAGDPFSDPSGPSSGSKVSDLLGRLVLIRPLEIIPSMATSASKDPAENVVRANVAVLDDPAQPGRVIENMLFFQNALKRDLGDIYRDAGKSLLIGRVAMGEKRGNNSAPYLFTRATDQEKVTAKQFLDARPF